MKITLFFLLVLLSLSGPALAQKANPTAQLTITDKKALEEWSRLTYGKTPSPDDPVGDTQFLVTLNPQQIRGAYLFRQHCDACHAPNTTTANSFGPRISKENLVDREDDIRTQIMDGSENMPAFKYAFQKSQVSDIIAFLKKVEPYCISGPGCGPGDTRRAAAPSQ